MAADYDYDEKLRDLDGDKIWEHHLLIPEVKGTKLGDIRMINSEIDVGFYDELEYLHDLLFDCRDSLIVMRINIKAFNGFEFKRDSREYDVVRRYLSCSKGNRLDDLCAILQLKRTGTRYEMALRVLEFLMKPSMEATIHGGRRRRPAIHKSKKRRSRIHLDDEEKQDEKEISGPHTVLMIPEILTRVFGFLNTRNKGRVAQVCRTWRDVAYRPCLWRNVVADWRPYNVIPTLVSSFVQRAICRARVHDCNGRFKFVMDTSDMSCINLSGWPHITNHDVMTVVDEIAKLRSLSFLGLEITDDLMLYFAKVPTLIKLDMRHCRKLTDNGIQQLVQHHEGKIRLQLESLSIHNALLTDQSLHHLHLGMQSLKSLCLRGGRFTKKGLRFLSHLASLEELDLSQNEEKISQSGLHCLFNGSAKLVSLTLSQCPFVNNNMLGLLAAVPTLRMLNVSRNDGVCEIGLAHLVKGGSKVDALDVSGCLKVRDAGLEHLTKLDSLRHLIICQCERITKNGMLALARSSGAKLTVTACRLIWDEVLSLFEGDQFRLISQSRSKLHRNYLDFANSQTQVHPLFLRSEIWGWDDWKVEFEVLRVSNSVGKV